MYRSSFISYSHCPYPTRQVFIFRLLLYMSVDAFFASLATIVYRLVLDYYRNNSQHEMAKSMTYLLMIYLVYLYTFLLCWLVMYLFLLAVFRVQLKKMKHEAIGLVIAVVTPVGFLWVSQWETKCEHNDNIKFAFLSIKHPEFLLNTTLLCFDCGCVTNSV